MVEISYEEFKALVLTGSVQYKHVESSNKYKIFGFDGPFSCKTMIFKNSIEAEDYESTFKSQGLKQINPLDLDTKAMSVTNNFAPQGFYQRLHEIEFTTATENGALHDKDHNNIDTNFSSVNFYEDIAGVETLMVSPTQADLDSKCIRTDYIFMPPVDYMIKSGVILQNEIPTSEVYMWGLMFDVDPSLNAYGLFPIEVVGGGMAMSFVGARKAVGLKGANGTMLYYAGAMSPTGFVALPPGQGTNRIRYIMRHEVGFKHRFQSIFEIFRA